MSDKLEPLRLPRGSCDTHSHVYPPTELFPVAEGHVREPGGSLEHYLALCSRLGIERHVLLQSKAYPDPGSTLYALGQLSPARARAMLFLPAQVDSRSLADWDNTGVRGFRFLYRAGHPIDLAELQRGADLASIYGWHIVVQAEGPELTRAYEALLALPCPVVIDHMGRLPRGIDRSSSDYRALLDFLSAGGWIKLASPYNLTVNGSSDFGPLADFIRGMLEVALHRTIWGLNFPHPNLPKGSKPDEEATLRSLFTIVQEEGTRQRLFVDNPATLYGFE